MRLSAILFVALFSTPVARAQIVVHVEGKDAGKIRGQLAKMVPSGQSTAERPFMDALVRQGLSSTLGDMINKPGDRGMLTDQIKGACKEAKVRMVVLARVLGNRLWVLAIDGASGSVEIDEAYSMPKRGGKKRRRRRTPVTYDLSQVRSALAPVFKKAKSAPAAVATGGGGGGGSSSGSGGGSDWGSSDWASPEWAGSGSSSADRLLGDSGDKDEDGEEEEEKVSTTHTRYKGRSGVGGAGILIRPHYTSAGRNFSYSGAQSGNLRPYEAMFISKIGVSLEAYPLVFAKVDIADDIGLRATYAQAVGLKSAPKSNEGNEIETTWSEIDAGATYRMGFGDTLLNANVSYGMLNFELNVPSGNVLAGQVQNLNYGFLRFGLDAHIGVGDLAILGGGAYRMVLSTGPLGDDFFPGSTAMGVDAHLGAAYSVMDMLEVYAIGDFVYFSHSLKSSATYVAKGATDMFYGLQLGVTLFF